MAFAKKKKPTGMTGGMRKKSATPAWVRAIPEGSHGSGTLQKRLWKLISDYVRIRDWYLYKGKCVATGVKILHWSDGDAGHYKSYSVCNGMYKFDPDNIHLQSKNSNAWGGGDIGYGFGEELKRRYGENYLTLIDEDNLLHKGEQLTSTKIIDMMRDCLHYMADLKEQPEYYKRVVKLLGE